MSINKYEDQVKEMIKEQLIYDEAEVNFPKKRGERTISVKRLRLRNPVLSYTIGQSKINNLSNMIKADEEAFKSLYNLWKQKRGSKRIEDEFNVLFQEIVARKLAESLIKSLKEWDIKTSDFPTGIEYEKARNYYVTNEKYLLKTKWELFSKLISNGLITSKLGKQVYGLLLLPEIADIYKGRIVKDLVNVDVIRLSQILLVSRRRGIFQQNITPFEFLFYLLDRGLTEIYINRTIDPKKYLSYPLELIVLEKTGGRKIFASHFIVPSLNEVFHKLYDGNEKYIRGRSKIAYLVKSLLIENWRIDDEIVKSNTQTAHSYLNRFLYYLFRYNKLDMDSVLHLINLKVKLRDGLPIQFLSEVILWMK